MADVALVPQRHILQRRGDIAPHHAGEAGNAQAAAAVANVEDAKVQLTAEVANAYVNLREAQFRAKAYRTECELQQQTLSLTYQRYQQGVLPLFPLGNANAELELLKSQLAEAEADTAVLQIGRAHV